MKGSECVGCDGGAYSSLPVSSVPGWSDVSVGSPVTVTFSEVGTYYYVCVLHSAMVGKIVVSSCDGECLSCPSGRYQGESGQSGCLSCPSGEYQGEVGQSGCLSCPSGEYQGEVGQSGCLYCPSGEYQGEVGQSGCLSCPSGRYQGEVGQSGCLSCPSGRYQGEVGQSGCLSCPLGEYQGEVGQSGCLSCPSGEYQGEVGQSGCASCPSGRYQGESGQSVCLSCPSGFGSLPGFRQLRGGREWRYDPSYASSVVLCNTAGMYQSVDGSVCFRVFLWQVSGPGGAARLGFVQGLSGGQVHAF